MNCKGEGCGVEIDYDKSRNPRAIEVATGQKHTCTTFAGKPKGNVDARVKRLEERLENVETAVKALVATSGGQEIL